MMDDIKNVIRGVIDTDTIEIDNVGAIRVQCSTSAFSLETLLKVRDACGVKDDDVFIEAETDDSWGGCSSCGGSASAHVYINIYGADPDRMLASKK